MRMNGPSWSTAALGRDDADGPADQVPLGEHLQRCRGAAGRYFALRCGAEMVQGFMAARFITTVLVVLSGVAGGSWLIFLR